MYTKHQTSIVAVLTRAAHLLAGPRICQVCELQGKSLASDWMMLQFDAYCYTELQALVHAVSCSGHVGYPSTLSKY